MRETELSIAGFGERPKTFPFKQAMEQLRKRWSNKRVIVSAPERPDYGNSLVALAHYDCLTDLIWKVVGPPEFLGELRGAVEGPPYFPEELLDWLGSKDQNVSLFLCHHEIRGG